jgi:4-hydroxybenzoate polyprenyltransferase
MFFLRALLTLARPAMLPTVWSNCLAGWWLSGHGNLHKLPFLFAGATLLYIGAAFMNDAFDADFDRQHRRTRPIPSGTLSADTVRAWGWVWIGLGLASLFWLNLGAGFFGVSLVCCIFLFNAVHRWVPASSVLLAICRFLVYMIGATAASNGVTGWPLWCGLALTAYVIGMGYYTRSEDSKAELSPWPALWLAAPILLALLMNANEYRPAALLLSLVLGLWCLRCLRSVFWPVEGSPVRHPAGLVAGIVFVDWLAVADAPRPLSLVFVGLFVTTLILQRLTPVRGSLNR